MKTKTRGRLTPGKENFKSKSARIRRIRENPPLKIGPDFDCVYRKNNHGGRGDHGDKPGRAMTFHFLIPVIPAPPVVVTVYAIANRSSRSLRGQRLDELARRSAEDLALAVNDADGAREDAFGEVQRDELFISDLICHGGLG